MAIAPQLQRYFNRPRKLMRNHFINRPANTPVNVVKHTVRGKHSQDLRLCTTATQQLAFQTPPKQPNDALWSWSWHVWQTCLRHVWACSMHSCLHRAYCLKPRQTLGHIQAFQHLILHLQVVAPKDKKLVNRRCCWCVRLLRVNLHIYIVTSALLSHSIPAFWRSSNQTFGCNHLQSTTYPKPRQRSRRTTNRALRVLHGDLLTVSIPSTKPTNGKNVLPPIHALPKVHHPHPTAHARLSQERSRRHLTRHLLRKLQSHSRQRQRTLSILLAGRQS
jgi:hypothetical protein